MIDLEAEIKRLFTKQPPYYGPCVKYFTPACYGDKNTKSLLKKSSTNLYSSCKSKGFDLK